MYGEISNLANALAKAEKKVYDSEETISKSKDEFARMNVEISALKDRINSEKTDYVNLSKQFKDYRRNAEERISDYRLGMCRAKRRTFKSRLKLLAWHIHRVRQRLLF